MNEQAQKLDLIRWIADLDDAQVLHQLAEIKEQARPNSSPVMRKFGDGKHIFTYVAEDFNEPLDDFREYMP